MANVKIVKLKDRNGSYMLPVSRSELIQATQIDDLSLLSGDSWSKASVQDVLEALASNASTSYTNLKNYVDAQDTTYLQSAKNYADTQDTTYLQTAKNYADTQDGAYLETAKTYAGTVAGTAETNAKNYADTNFIKGIKLNNTPQTPDENRIVDLGTIATSSELTELSNRVTYIESTYALGADLTNLSDAYTAGYNSLNTRIGTVETNYPVTITPSDDLTYLKKYTITQGSTTLGTIDIPKDLVAIHGEIVNSDGTNSGTFIKLTIQNGDPVYVDVASLIEYNTFEDTTEIDFTDTNHTITAYVVSIPATKVAYNGSNVDAELTSINSTISGLQSSLGGVSYTVEAKSGESYINVIPSGTGTNKTFTIETIGVASSANLEALQTSYTNLNTTVNNLSSSLVDGVSYVDLGTVADVTLFDA